MDVERIRILLVEDSADDCAIIGRMLAKYRRAEFVVETVESGRACLEALNAGTIDFILLDHGLPDMNGIGLLRALGERQHTPPAIMLTGLGDERIAVEAIANGAYDYFPKDAITSEMLGHAIHQAIGKFRAEQELVVEQLEGSERVIFALASAAEAKDPTTGRHLQRLAAYATRLGRALCLDDRELLVLRYGALLHDIGKIGVSETIVSKVDALTDDEWAEIRQHPVIGERICQPLRLADDIRPVVRHHHERWDGGGYPDGLAGEAIPRLARVVTIVDSFDAMANPRPYRPALAAAMVLEELAAGAGLQFDPQMTATFLELLERAPGSFGLRGAFDAAA
jgi:putative two-component system response regulator